ncbi:MAG: hypothetical protein KME49_16665 [Brasilonema octagenarum HA4186-MV1]|nr:MULTISPECIES: hypothetical protein [Brasilonema]MBW4627087.1 hypothetical protein [Brasilonema octagenarum HA4186-MV1]
MQYAALCWRKLWEDLQLRRPGGQQEMPVLQQYSKWFAIHENTPTTFS